MKKKIGILGGTFNPVHLGHIKLAEGAFKALKLSRIYFVPAYSPPLKPGAHIVSPIIRYEMVELAINGMPDFDISDIELKRKGTSYSIDTVEEFKKKYGGSAEIFFITGADSIEEFQKWRAISRLTKLCRLVVASRPGYSAELVAEDMLAININTPRISSSGIRKKIKDGSTFRGMVPERVYDYILKHKLYL